MIKFFNFLRFGFDALQENPAPGFMVSPRKDKTKINTAFSKPMWWSFHSVKYILAILAVIALLIGGGWYYYSQRTASMLPLAGQMPGNSLSNDQLEAQYGIRITLIAVTLGGGVVDFQYRIADPKKAARLLQDPHKMPILSTLDKDLKLYPSRMVMHNRSKNRNYAPVRFYANARGAVKPGTPVAVLFGDVRVGPIIAQ